MRVYKDLVRRTTFGTKETEKEKTKVVSLSLSKSRVIAIKTLVKKKLIVR